MHVKTGLAILAIGTLATGSLATTSALAQTTPVPAPGTKQVIPEKQAEPLQNGRSESLSKKLSRTDGVITPKTNVDPGIHAPTPTGPHTMPVIPPSATGGDTAK